MQRYFNKINKKSVLGASLLLLNLTCYAADMSDYNSLTDYIKANHGNFADYDVDYDQANVANPNDKADATNERSHFIKNNCDCDQYVTLVEDGRQDNHHMRTELWIPKGGLIIEDVQSQAFYFEGAQVHTKSHHIWSHENDTTFYKFITVNETANNMEKCYITFLSNSTYEYANCM